jgi:hypothetical protein
VVSFLEPGKTLRKIGPTAFVRCGRAMLNEHFPTLRQNNCASSATPAWRGRDNDSSEHDCAGIPVSAGTPGAQSQEQQAGAAP